MTAPDSRLSRLARALAVVVSRPPVAVASTPLKLRNPLNGGGLSTSRGARMASNARRQKERAVGRTLALRLEGTYSGDDFAVVLTRISPRPFDDDNNAAALKSVRDGMAQWWGIDDGSDDVVWVCDWRKGAKDAVEAALWVLPVETPKRGLTALLGAIPMPSDVDADADDYARPLKPGEWLPMPHKDSPEVKPDSWLLEAAQKTGRVAPSEQPRYTEAQLAAIDKETAALTKHFKPEVVEPTKLRKAGL